MRLRVVAASLFLIFSHRLAIGQFQEKFIIGECGADFISTQYAMEQYIRGDELDATSGLLQSHSIRNNMNRVFLGARMEIRNGRGNVGISAGLHFSMIESSLLKNGPPSYFYFLVAQSGTTTEYLKVKELTQLSYYGGVPVEVRVFVYRPRAFRLFVTAGFEFGYKLADETIVVFDDPSMDQYASEVKAVAGHTENWFTTLYMRAGFLLGKKDKPRVSMGITGPVFISNSASTLVKPVAGAGIFVTMQFPQGRKAD
jgi:hypothetical protein